MNNDVSSHHDEKINIIINVHDINTYIQVVHAKWGEMMEKGDRDICYYNERCYRPYLGENRNSYS